MEGVGPQCQGTGSRHRRRSKLRRRYVAPGDPVPTCLGFLPMIRFDQVTKFYARNSRPALGEVTLEVLKGEFVFLVGASGSGKSSFLRLVLKEEKPSKGKIHVLGQELNTLASRKVPYFRRNLGVVFQDF